MLKNLLHLGAINIFVYHFALCFFYNLIFVIIKATDEFMII